MAESCSLSKSGVNCADPQISCEGCNVFLTDPEDSFICKFCLVDSSSNCYRCQFCIVSHLRQLHEVKDFFGREVGMCMKHRNLIVSVCKTCREMICMECFLSHAKHDCVDLKSHAAQLKRRIHSSLDECLTGNKVAAKRFQASDKKLESWLKVVPFTNANEAAEYFKGLLLSVASEKTNSMSLQWLDALKKEKEFSFAKLKDVERKEDRLRSLLSHSNYTLAVELKDVPENSSFFEISKINEVDVQPYQNDLEHFQTDLLHWEKVLKNQFGDSIANFFQRINPNTWKLEQMRDFCDQNYAQIAASDSALCILHALEIKRPSIELVAREDGKGNLCRLSLSNFYHNFSSTQFKVFSSPSGIAIRKHYDKMMLYQGICFDHREVAIPTTENVIGAYTSEKGVVFVNYLDHRIVFSGGRKFSILFSQQPRYVKVVEDLSKKIHFCAAVLVENSPKIHLYMYTDSNDNLVKKFFDASHFGMPYLDSIMFTKVSESDAYWLLCWNLKQKRMLVIKSVINCEHFLPNEENMISIHCESEMKEITVFQNDLFILTADAKVLRKVDFLTPPRKGNIEASSCAISKQQEPDHSKLFVAGTSK